MLPTYDLELRRVTEIRNEDRLRKKGDNTSCSLTQHRDWAHYKVRKQMDIVLHIQYINNNITHPIEWKIQEMVDIHNDCFA